jgi:hypothetical protein
MPELGRRVRILRTIALIGDGLLSLEPRSASDVFVEPDVDFPGDLGARHHVFDAANRCPTSASTYCTWTLYCSDDSKVCIDHP